MELQYESMDDAKRVAKEVLLGEIDPNLGCGLIAGICKKLNYPDNLTIFDLLAHEQTGHEHLGITGESLVPEIIEACRELLQKRA